MYLPGPNLISALQQLEEQEKNIFSREKNPLRLGSPLHLPSNGYNPIATIGYQVPGERFQLVILCIFIGHFLCAKPFTWC